MSCKENEACVERDTLSHFRKSGSPSLIANEAKARVRIKLWAWLEIFIFEVKNNGKEENH